MRYIGILLFTLLAFAVTAQSGVRSHLAGRTAGDSTGLKVVVIDTTTSGADYGRTTLVDSTYLATALGVGSGTNLYNADGTIGSGRNGTITDSLTLTGGHLVIDQNIANKPALITTNGNSAGAATKAQLKFGWSGNPSISAYAQWITSTHTGGAGSGNAIDFWLSDGTATPTFPTDAMHAMTIERSSGQPRVGIGLGDNVTPGGMFEVNGGNMIIQGIGGAYDPSLSIYKDDGQSAGINFYDESSDRYWAFLHGNDDFTLSRYIADVFQDNPWRMYNSDGDMSVNYLAVNSSATNPTRPFEVHDDGVAATEFIVDPNTSSGYSVELNIGDVSADLSTSSGSRPITFSPNTTEVLNLDDTEITSKVDHEFDADFLDINNATGTSGQILSSLGGSNAGVDWIDAPSGGDTDWVVSGNHVYPTNTTDSVGIGNAAPGFNLHVTGDATVTSQLLIGSATPPIDAYELEITQVTGDSPLLLLHNQTTDDAVQLFNTDDGGLDHNMSIGLDHDTDAFVIADGTNLSGNDFVVNSTGIGVGIEPDEELVVSGSGNTIARIETTGSSEQALIELESGEDGVGSAGTVSFYNNDADISGSRYSVGTIQVSKNHATNVDNTMQFKIGYNSTTSQTAMSINSATVAAGGEEAVVRIDAGLKYQNIALRNATTTLSEEHYMVYKDDTNPYTYTLPDASTVTGHEFHIANFGSSADITIAISGSDDINGAASGPFFTIVPGDSRKFIAWTTNKWTTLD